MFTQVDVRAHADPVDKTDESPSLTAQNLLSSKFNRLHNHPQLTRRRLEPEQHLYRAGQRFQSLFLIHAGSMKIRVLTSDGREQVIGFRMRGDLLGVESIGAGAYSCDSIALESGEIWELPYPACLRIAELQDSLAAALAQEIRRDHSWMLALGTLAAEQRIAAFLLDLAARYQALGFSGKRFRLRMSRVDMASYLVLKHETVSRALSHLVATGCLVVDRRDVHILDEEALYAVAAMSAQTDKRPYTIAAPSMLPRTAAASCSLRYGLRSSGIDLDTAVPA
jgi:CRP/FNR family transcriptional regulator